jgi:thioredoxin 1
MMGILMKSSLNPTNLWLLISGRNGADPAPIIEELSNEYSGKVVVAKCDVDNNPQVTSKFGIRNIPTVLFFKDGKIADKQVGAVPKNNFVNKLNAIL